MGSGSSVAYNQSNMDYFKKECDTRRQIFQQLQEHAKIHSHKSLLGWSKSYHFTITADQQDTTKEDAFCVGDGELLNPPAILLEDTGRTEEITQRNSIIYVNNGKTLEK